MKRTRVIKRDDLSEAFVKKVARMPELQHAAVRIGLWIVALAEEKGGFPVKFFQSHMINGYKDEEGVTMPGIAFRPPTVHKSLEALQDAGLLQVIDRGERRHGRPIYSYSMDLD